MVGYTPKYASDNASIVAFGLAKRSVSGGWFIDGTGAQDYADWLVAEYPTPRIRPTLTVTNRFPSQLQRDVGDTVTLNFARLGISSVQHRILKVSTSVTEGGRRWETQWLLEPT
jgi:hypothetical protein